MVPDQQGAVKSQMWSFPQGRCSRVKPVCKDAQFLLWTTLNMYESKYLIAVPRKQQ